VLSIYTLMSNMIESEYVDTIVQQEGSVYDVMFGPNTTEKDRLLMVLVRSTENDPLVYGGMEPNDLYISFAKAHDYIETLRDFL